ncbi:hypothetical protein ACWGBV_16075 [Streptomyces sp. NPDC055051]
MHQPRYALLSGLHAVALCHDVRGLYGDPAPPPRVRHELRGCEPRGELARAVTQAIVEGTAPLGTLDVETPDTAWRLTAVRVLGARGDVVTVESAGPPRRLHGTHGAVPCGNLVRVSPEPPEELTHGRVTFLGCSPRGALRDALAAGAAEYEAVRYQILDLTAGPQYEAEAGRVTAVAASRRHHELVDLTVAFPRAGLLPHRHREVWDLFHDHEPPAPGTWRRFTGTARTEWLRQAARRAHRTPRAVTGETYTLDGRATTDGDAFLCALGEAVLGPGRAFPGGTPRTLGPALSGSTLVWRDAATARACLGVTPLLAEPRPPTFQEWVDGLGAAGVHVVLA